MGGQPGTQPALGRGTRSSNDAVVLYVDDDRDMLETIETVLTASGYGVVCAASGEAKAMMPRAPMAARTLPVMPLMPDSPAGASPYLTGLGRRR